MIGVSKAMWCWYILGSMNRVCVVDNIAFKECGQSKGWEYPRSLGTQWLARHPCDMKPGQWGFAGRGPGFLRYLPADRRLGLLFWLTQEVGVVGVGEAVAGLQLCPCIAPSCRSWRQTEIEWLLTFISKKDSFVFQRWASRQRPCGHSTSWGTLQWWSDFLFSGLWQLWVPPRLWALNQSSESLEVWLLLSTLKGYLFTISALSTSPFHSLMVLKIILEKPFGGFILGMAGGLNSCLDSWRRRVA